MEPLAKATGVSIQTSNQESKLMSNKMAPKCAFNVPQHQTASGISCKILNYLDFVHFVWFSGLKWLLSWP